MLLKFLHFCFFSCEPYGRKVTTINRLVKLNPLKLLHNIPNFLERYFIVQENSFSTVVVQGLETLTLPQRKVLINLIEFIIKNLINSLELVILISLSMSHFSLLITQKPPFPLKGVRKALISSFSSNKQASLCIIQHQFSFNFENPKSNIDPNPKQKTQRINSLELVTLISLSTSLAHYPNLSFPSKGMAKARIPNFSANKQASLRIIRQNTTPIQRQF